jgi:hypothetical protein
MSFLSTEVSPLPAETLAAATNVVDACAAAFDLGLSDPVRAETAIGEWMSASASATQLVVASGLLGLRRRIDDEIAARVDEHRKAVRQMHSARLADRFAMAVALEVTIDHLASRCDDDADPQSACDGVLALALELAFAACSDAEGFGAATELRAGLAALGRGVHPLDLLDAVADDLTRGARA